MRGFAIAIAAVVLCACAVRPVPLRVEIGIEHAAPAPPAAVQHTTFICERRGAAPLRCERVQ